MRLTGRGCQLIGMTRFPDVPFPEMLEWVPWREGMRGLLSTEEASLGNRALLALER